MELISTTTLANEHDIKPAELFEKFRAIGWIERKNNKWILTDRGKEKGGRIKNNPNYGEYIVWPEDISWENRGKNEKAKYLNATALGKQFNISSQRFNLLLNELGGLKKPLLDGELRSWAKT